MESKKNLPKQIEKQKKHIELLRGMLASRSHTVRVFAGLVDRYERAYDSLVDQSQEEEDSSGI